MKRLIILLLVLPLFLISCKKDEDDEKPVIEIQSPANGAQANVYDTLHVRIHVTDNMKLENMNVRLVTTDLISVLPAVSILPGEKSYDAVFDYVISNFHIASGNYYLSVDASDGTNVAHAYTTIYVTGIPKALKGFFAAAIPIPSTLNIYQGDTSWTASLFTSYANDFTDMAVSNYWQQVYTNGIYTGPLKATSIDGTTAGFSIPSVSGPNPYWGPLSVAETRLWVSYRADGIFKSLDQNGAQSFNSSATQSLYPWLMLQLGDKIYVEQKDISSAVIKMVVYSTSGGVIHQTVIPADPLAFFERTADEVYVLGNSAGQGHLMIYDNTTNGFWEPVTLPAGTVTCATTIDANTILIGMSDGNIYRFTYMPVGILTWATGVSPAILRYDDVNAEVYSAEGTNVKVYSYNPFVLQHTIPIPYAVSDLELWYNK